MCHSMQTEFLQSTPGKLRLAGQVRGAISFFNILENRRFPAVRFKL